MRLELIRTLEFSKVDEKGKPGDISLALYHQFSYRLGIILVGCAPGGTASNVVCYLAKGDVALSISLTVCSTILAVFFMP